MKLVEYQHKNCSVPGKGKKYEYVYIQTGAGGNKEYVYIQTGAENKFTTQLSVPAQAIQKRQKASWHIVNLIKSWLKPILNLSEESP